MAPGAEQKQHEQDHAQAQATGYADIAPAPGVLASQGQRQERHGRGEQDDAHGIGNRAGVGIAVLTDESPGQEQDRRTHRQVDHEHRAPAEPVDQQPA